SNSTGGATMVGFYRPDGTTIGSITQNTATTVAYNTTSDRRLKDNIVNTHFGINDLMRIKVRDYVYKADPAHMPTTGFIAQELYDIFPNAVSKPANEEEMWSIDYGKVTPLLVKAIQDQQTTIEAQQKQIDELKKMVESLMKK
ncbi:MAG: tail fiber domain-containing protein, partial [Campylobacteraceae bacterium]|nr:tail fiber domain-containing protein [Campylobacteraceae bacterium]